MLIRCIKGVFVTGMRSAPSMPEMSHEVVLITPTIAKEWLLRNSPDNRPINASNVDRYAGDMRMGKWELTHQSIAFDSAGVLIDGQTRLTAIVRSNMSVRMLVARCANLLISSNIDTGGIRHLPFLTGWSSRHLSVLRFILWMNGGARSNIHRKMTPAQVYAGMVQMDQRLFARFSGNGHERFVSAGLIAAALYVAPLSEDKAASFVQQVRTGELLERGDPAYAFRAWLFDAKGQLPSEHISMAALSAMWAEINGKRHSKIVTGAKLGYRAVTARRRAMGTPHTPTLEEVGTE